MPVHTGRVRRGLPVYFATTRLHQGCARALVSRARTVPVQLLPSAHGWGSLQLFYTHLLIIMMLGTPDLTLMSNGAYHGV